MQGAGLVGSGLQRPRSATEFARRFRRMKRVVLPPLLRAAKANAEIRCAKSPAVAEVVRGSPERPAAGDWLGVRARCAAAEAAFGADSDAAPTREQRDAALAFVREMEGISEDQEIAAESFVEPPPLNQVEYAAAFLKDLRRRNELTAIELAERGAKTTMRAKEIARFAAGGFFGLATYTGSLALAGALPEGFARAFLSGMSTSLGFGVFFVAYKVAEKFTLDDAGWSMLKAAPLEILRRGIPAGTQLLLGGVVLGPAGVMGAIVFKAALDMALDGAVSYAMRAILVEPDAFATLVAEQIADEELDAREYERMEADLRNGRRSRCFRWPLLARDLLVGDKDFRGIAVGAPLFAALALSPWRNWLTDWVADAGAARQLLIPAAVSACSRALASQWVQRASATAKSALWRAVRKTLPEKTAREVQHRLEHTMVLHYASCIVASAMRTGGVVVLNRIVTAENARDAIDSWIQRSYAPLREFEARGPSIDPEPGVSKTYAYRERQVQGLENELQRTRYWKYRALAHELSADAYAALPPIERQLVSTAVRGMSGASLLDAAELAAWQSRVGASAEAYWLGGLATLAEKEAKILRLLEGDGETTPGLYRLLKDAWLAERELAEQYGVAVGEDSVIPGDVVAACASLRRMRLEPDSPQAQALARDAAAGRYVRMSEQEFAFMPGQDRDELSMRVVQLQYDDKTLPSSQLRWAQVARWQREAEESKDADRFRQMRDLVDRASDVPARRAEYEAALQGKSVGAVRWIAPAELRGPLREPTAEEVRSAPGAPTVEEANRDNAEHRIFDGDKARLNIPPAALLAPLTTPAAQKAALDLGAMSPMRAAAEAFSSAMARYALAGLAGLERAIMAAGGARREREEDPDGELLYRAIMAGEKSKQKATQLCAGLRVVAGRVIGEDGGDAASCAMQPLLPRAYQAGKPFVSFGLQMGALGLSSLAGGVPAVAAKVVKVLAGGTQLGAYASLGLSVNSVAIAGTNAIERALADGDARDAPVRATNELIKSVLCASQPEGTEQCEGSYMYLNKVAAVGTATHKFASLARRLVDEIKATERAAGGFWETMAAPLQTARIVTSLLGKLFELDEDSLTLMLGSADISTARAAFERMRASGRGTESLVGEWLSVLIAPTSLRRRTWQNN